MGDLVLVVNTPPACFDSRGMMTQTPVPCDWRCQERELGPLLVCKFVHSGRLPTDSSTLVRCSEERSGGNVALL
jgi:hypothetical protein